MDLSKYIAEQIIIDEIMRSDMPQIKGKDFTQVLDIFKNYGVPYRYYNVNIDDLFPIQKDFIPEKIDNIVKDIKAGKEMNPIFISSDYYIIDGHDRWLANKKLGNKIITTIKIGYPKNAALQLFTKSDSKLNETTNKIKNIIAVYPGRFQPFHKGHYVVYEDLVNKFGAQNVFIATSDVTEPGKSPFNFSEKRNIINKLFGIPTSKIIKVKNPYKPEEILKLFDPKTTALVIAVGEKDINRLGGKYFTKYNGKPSKNYLDGAYVYSVPQLNVKVNGQTISGTVIRNNFSKDIFKALYPTYDESIFKLMKKKLSKNTISEDKSEYLNYLKKVKAITIENYNKYFNDILNGKKRNKEFYLHYKYPISSGFINNIPPEVIGHYKNLEILPHSINETKAGKNSITLEQLILDIQNSKNPLDNKILLLCGGAFGHLVHPFEDMNLTFGDLKLMITTALEGKLELTQEKTDGQNLMFSWIDGKLKVARNLSHIKNFGKNALDLSGLSNMFSGRGEIHTAFTEAYKDLEAAISKLSQKQKEKIFANGKKFMSVEVIYPQTTNVIPYNFAMLVFHGTFEYDKDGNIIGEDKSTASTLAEMIKQINADIQNTFQIRAPNNLKLPKVQNFSTQKSYYLGKLNKLQNKYKLKDTDTVMLYHQSWWEEFISKQAKSMKYNIPNDILMDLVKRWAFNNKSVKIIDLKKRIDNEAFRTWVDTYDKNSYIQQFKDNIKPFELLFLELGAQILKNINVFLSVNPDESIQQIKTAVDKAIKDIESSNDINAINKMTQQLQRLNAIGGMDAVIPSEGITFMFNGKLYKLTGAFSPINQLLGILKYGNR